MSYQFQNEPTVALAQITNIATHSVDDRAPGIARMAIRACAELLINGIATPGMGAILGHAQQLLADAASTLKGSGDIIGSQRRLIAAYRTHRDEIEALA